MYILFQKNKFSFFLKWTFLTCQLLHLYTIYVCLINGGIFVICNSWKPVTGSPLAPLEDVVYSVNIVQVRCPETPPPSEEGSPASVRRPITDNLVLVSCLLVDPQLLSPEQFRTLYGGLQQSTQVDFNSLDMLVRTADTRLVRKVMLCSLQHYSPGNLISLICQC